MKKHIIQCLPLILIVACTNQVATSRSENNNNSEDALVTTNEKSANSPVLDKTDYSIYRTIMEASVDGAAGIVINQQMDKQAEELEKELKEAKIKRVGQGIQLTMASSLFFDSDSEFLNIKSKNTLKNLALVLNKYDNNYLMIEAHTDALGDMKFNKELTKERALNIKDYLISQGIDAIRIFTSGYAGLQPIADNETQGGQLLNRRIEVGIFSSPKAKDAVLRGDIK